MSSRITWDDAGKHRGVGEEAGERETLGFYLEGGYSARLTAEGGKRYLEGSVGDSTKEIELLEVCRREDHLDYSDVDEAATLAFRKLKEEWKKYSRI
jgi:hypothetical protein